MEWFNADVCSLKTAFEQAPKILHPVGVNVASNVGADVVDDLVDITLPSQSGVTYPLIGKDVRPRLDILTNFGLQRLSLDIRKMLSLHLAATFQNAHDNRLADTTCAATAPFVAGFVHVASQS